MCLRERSLKVKLREAWGKKIKVTFRDGLVLEGKGEYYHSEVDNPEGEASLCIGTTMFFESEVEKIELIV